MLPPWRSPTPSDTSTRLRPLCSGGVGWLSCLGSLLSTRGWHSSSRLAVRAWQRGYTIRLDHQVELFVYWDRGKPLHFTRNTILFEKQATKEDCLFWSQKIKEKIYFSFPENGLASDYHLDNRSPPCEIGCGEALLNNKRSEMWYKISCGYR